MNNRGHLLFNLFLIILIIFLRHILNTFEVVMYFGFSVITNICNFRTTQREPV